MIERKVAHFARHTDACVVEHVIQAAVCAYGIFHQAFDILGARDIEERGRSPAAIRGDRRGHCLRACGVDIGHHCECAAAG